jgi:RNA polymerase sigma-70 factor (ECF subfamily)
MVRLRLDGRLRGRVRSDAVLDQVSADAAGRIGEFLADPGRSFFLWLRDLTARRLDRLHRDHLGEPTPEAGRELRLSGGSLPTVTAGSMAAQLLGDRQANSAATRADLLLRLQGALNGLDPLDREILALRNFEELTGEEAAAVLGLDKTTALVRHLQAVRRLTDVLATIPGFTPRRRPPP